MSISGGLAWPEPVILETMGACNPVICICVVIASDNLFFCVCLNHLILARQPLQDPRSQFAYIMTMPYYLSIMCSVDTLIRKVRYGVVVQRAGMALVIAYP